MPLIHAKEQLSTRSLASTSSQTLVISPAGQNPVPVAGLFKQRETGGWWRTTLSRGYRCMGELGWLLYERGVLVLEVC